MTHGDIGLLDRKQVGQPPPRAQNGVRPADSNVAENGAIYTGRTQLC